MGDFNKVLLMGRLGAEPEQRDTTTGSKVTRLRVATTHVRKGDTEDVHDTDWHDVVTFGTLAENCGRYLTKGRQVFIEGRLASDVWTDKDGNKRVSREVIARRVDFLHQPKAKPDAAPQAEAQLA